MRTLFNFSAGPAMLPEDVLRQADRELLDWHGTGMSVMEMSHREKDYMGIHAQAQADLRALLAALIAKAEAEKATLIIAYTHGQPAQPTTFGHYLAALIEILLRDLARLEAARQTVNLCSMGAAAITTSGFATDRARVAELLGFAAPQENSYGCIAAVDYITAPYAAIELVFLHLGALHSGFAIPNRL